MRGTVSVPDRIVHDLKTHVTKERKSVSSLVTEFIDCGVKGRKRRAARERILQMTGKVKVNKGAFRMLDRMRSEDDRT